MPGIRSKPVGLNFAEHVIFKGATIQEINGCRMCSNLVPDDRTTQGQQT
jgi:hypothetical protein